MKKYIAALLVTALCLTCLGCAGKAPEAENTPETVPAPVTAAPAETDAAPVRTPSKKEIRRPAAETSAVTEAAPEQTETPLPETLPALETQAPAEPPAPAAAAGERIPQIFSSDEYTLYQNIFYNQTGGDYLGAEMTKTGVYAKIHDSFNNRDRYYVWGYYDQTKCCDWQWEFVPENPDAMPAPGSLVEMTGTFSQSGDALDGYWFTAPALTVLEDYPQSAEVPMTAMSATLERVQLINMQVFPDDYSGKTVSMYGRVFSLNQIQHPYYDDVWTQEFADAQEVPPIGEEVILTGICDGGVIRSASVTATPDY